MLWKQLLKVRKAKCQDWVKIWRNFQQDPNQSFKIISKIHRRDLDSENKKRGFGDEMMEDLKQHKIKCQDICKMLDIIHDRIDKLKAEFDRTPSQSGVPSTR